VCDQGNLGNEEAIAALGYRARENNNNNNNNNNSNPKVPVIFYVINT
jgi:hypothetical protein